MSKAISINIGVDKVSYNPQTFGPLNSCAKDAKKMAEIAEVMGFKDRIILTDEQATADEVRTQICNAAKHLESNGICLITFSGHGGYRRDGFPMDEEDKEMEDESWCLYDRQMFDDEFKDLWIKFADVRIVVVSDSCHSNTVIDFFEPFIKNRFLLLKAGFDFRAFENMLLYENGLKSIKCSESSLKKNSKILKNLKLESKVKLLLPNIVKMNFEERIKSLPRQVLQKNFSDNKKIYDDARLKVERSLVKTMADNKAKSINQLKNASIILLSACEDGDTTKDGKTSGENSVYTQALLDVWDNKKFSKSYEEFNEEIYQKLKAQGFSQIPKYFRTGIPNTKFSKQIPFTVEFP